MPNVGLGNDVLSEAREKMIKSIQESSVGSEVLGNGDAIKNLEKKRKKNGKLSKEDSKLLHELNLVDMKWKREKQAAKNSEKKSEKSRTDCTESADSSGSEVSPSREKKPQVNSNFEAIPTIRARLVTRVPEEKLDIRVPDERMVNSDPEEMFDYNSLQPRMVVAGTIDYLTPVVKVKDSDTKLDERDVIVEGMVQSPEMKDLAVSENKSNEEGATHISELTEERLDRIGGDNDQKSIGLNADPQKFKGKLNAEKKVVSEAKGDMKKSQTDDSEEVKNVNKTCDFLSSDRDLVKVALFFSVLSQCRDAEKKYYSLLGDSSQ